MLLWCNVVLRARQTMAASAWNLKRIGFSDITRERAYFSTFLPALTYQPGLTPILGGAAMLIGGGVLGLLVMRLVGGPDTPRKNGN